MALGLVDMNAWLLTWEGTTGPALVPDNKILAILSSRRSAGTVAEIVDTLYCRSVDSAFDMALLANKRKQREHQYRHLHSTFHRIFYGRNPFIFARVVSQIKIKRDEERNSEIICWTEIPVYGNAVSGSTPVEVEPAREYQLVRSLAPLCRDIYASDA